MPEGPVPSMPKTRVPNAFDQIAPSYDATREPIDPATLAEVGRLFHAAGVRSLLEVGVGTGRVAVPLAAAGFTVLGLDASSAMLAQARAKGLERLVRGSAYRLPFPDHAADATLLVHVLHLLEDPRTALEEATRVGRYGAFALVHPRPPGKARVDRRGNAPRRAVYRILAERGYPVPATARGGPPVRERRLLRRFPPESLTVVSDRMVTEPVNRRLEMLAQGASRHTLHIPRDVLRQAVAEARAEVGDQTLTYRRVEALAHWSAEGLAARAGRAGRR
jgi:SAM-dependent methyltransferase